MSRRRRACGRDCFGKVGEREAVDNRLGPIGEVGEHCTIRPRISRRQLDDPDRPVARAQTFDDVSVK